jgi:glycosyltransferase involved in cell wall biosynthesis
MDIMIRPSLTGDPWGRDIIESMACRKAVIASGSYDLLIKNGHTGFLVKPGNVEELADKIITLIKDDALRISMAKNAFEHVKDLCNMPAYGTKIDKLYSQLLSA